MSISAGFASHGSVDLYVPIVDWGVRAEPYTAPIRMSATLVSVNRQAALRTLQTPDDARAHLTAVEPNVVRADAGGQGTLIQKLRAPFVDLQPQLAGFRVPVEIEVASQLLRARHFLRDCPGRRSGLGV